MKKEINLGENYNSLEGEPEKELENELDKMPVRLPFGAHPGFIEHCQELNELYRENPSREREDQARFGIETPISKFFNKLHPEVSLIPTSEHLNVVNKKGGSLEGEREFFPFSSFDFYIDKEQKETSPNIFQEFYHSAAFSRLGKIGQLHHLIPFWAREPTREQTIPLFALPWFTHTRKDHSILTAALMEVVLACNGFSEEKRAPAVLAAACHDIAMPAGGDLVKGIDYKNLDEEENFSLVMERSGLAERWKKQFGFDLLMASDWVKNKHLTERLLDALDKISYTALDCYYIGKQNQQQQKESEINSLCARYPLIMDVWQDIQFTPDKTDFGFSDPNRLFQFLLLRARAFEEVYTNLGSKPLTYFLRQKTQSLYEKGLITKEQLLTNDDEWLMSILNKYYFEEIRECLEPGSLCWKRFSTPEEQKEFADQIGSRKIYLKHETGFKTGLDLPIISQDKKRVAPIREVIDKKKIAELEKISNSNNGYYVYYRAER